MPGGHTQAWEHIKPIFQGIAAKVGKEPCCDWVGEDGAGHYVKMVHNGIEYGDMQVREREVRGNCHTAVMILDQLVIVFRNGAYTQVYTAYVERAVRQN